MRPPRALLAIVAVLILVATPFVLGGPAALVNLLPERSVAGPPAPPVIALRTPLDGDGTALKVLVEGDARSEDALVTDVQVRLDGERWNSVPSAPRGQRVVPFSIELDVAPGHHVVEARAYDGTSYSLVARATIASDATRPPTVRVLAPSDGAGVREGSLDVRGLVDGPGPLRVFVRAGDAPETEATVSEAGARGAAWVARVDAPHGVFDVVARAVGAGGASVPRLVTVAGSDPAPPEVLVLRPSDGSAFGPHGATACDGCVQFSGLAGGARVDDVRVSLDGGAWRSLRDEPGATLETGPEAAWTWPLRLQGVFSGPHTARFVAVSDGVAGAPRAVTVLVRADASVRILGDDAPRATLTPLQFSVEGAPKDVEWRLDGGSVGRGASVLVHLPTPGDHVLEARVQSDGRVGGARVPLFALNQPPLVTLAASAGLARSPLALVATGTDVDGRVASYLWDFGDGSTMTSSTHRVEHSYSLPGSYTARVIAVDDRGATSAPFRAPVTVGNSAPHVAFSWEPREPTVFDTVRFVDESVDAEERILDRLWRFPDGTTANTTETLHRFPSRGDHKVTLRVTDADGGVSLHEALVHVANVAPKPSFTIEPAFPQTADLVWLNDTTVKPDGTLASWSWSLGDGTNATSRNVTHAFDRPGTYNVTLIVRDDQGASALAARQIVVADARPLVRAIEHEPLTPAGMDAVAFRALATDLEGGIVRFEWDFGDGVTSNETAPTHRFAKSGAYDVSVAAYDAAGQRGVLTIVVPVKNALPTVELVVLEGGHAAFPTILEARSNDRDGRVRLHAIDVDADGSWECFGASPRCTLTFAEPGERRVRVMVEDDEAGVGVIERLLDVKPRPSGLGGPHVRIDAPVPDATLRGRFEVSGAALSQANVSRVEAQLRNATSSYAPGGSPWALAEGRASWKLLLDTRAVKDGAYDLVVRATDENGAWDERIVPVRVSNGDTTRRMAVTIELADDAEIDGSLIVRGTAYHPAGPTSVRWRVDDGSWRDVEGSLVSWGVPITTDGLAPGEHVLEVEAWHGLTERDSARARFVVPLKAPPILDVDAPPAPVAHGILHMEGRASEGARVLWRYGHGVWREAAMGGERWVVDASTDNVRAGEHLVRVKAVAPDGAQTPERSFLVRVVGPAELGDDPRPTGARREAPGVALAGAVFAIAFVALLSARRQ